jgi:hypothetical protein
MKGFAPRQCDVFVPKMLTTLADRIRRRVMLLWIAGMARECGQNASGFAGRDDACRVVQ